MKKTLAAILSVACISCTAFAVAACSGSGNNSAEPNYYTITCASTDGITYSFYMLDNNGEKVTIYSGMEVKEGCTVYFTYKADDDVLGEAQFTANDDKVLKPNSENVYSVVMDKNTQISVSGVFRSATYEVSFKQNDYVHYYIDGKEMTDNFTVSSGESIKLKVGISPYYGDSEYSVVANQTVLYPDADGYYTFNATSDVVFDVNDLVLDDSFLTRENGGSGTKADPYKIERPIDLYVLADRINDDYWLGSYSSCYYEMTADIDMQGEQLYIIGDGTTDTAFFCGDFNGNNHTISNYVIKDRIYEQSEFNSVFMPTIGLFGQVYASYTRQPSIYNLNLENFKMDINATSLGSTGTFYAGGLIGYAIGANVTNCTASGTITAQAASNLGGMAYVGGLIGFQQSAYVSDSLRYYSAVKGCSTDVEINGIAGYIYSAGGISGYLYSYEQKTAAYILNSYSSGNIMGAMNVGGIAGRVSPYSSIQNCYSVSEYLDAESRVVNTEYPIYQYAYAGGIAGYVENDSVVANCFANTQTSAGVASGVSSSYAVSGGIVGGYSKGDSTDVQSASAYLVNNYDNATITDTFLKNTLGWSDKDWTFNGTYPTVNLNSTSPSLTITFDCGSYKIGTNSSFSVTLGDYLPISAWYGNQISQFVTATTTNGNYRSYGYFFKDANGNLTKVPYAYIFTGNEQLVVNFADYSEVEGVYYLHTSTAGSGIYIQLCADGSLIYRDGALSYTSSYIYDGNVVTLYDCPALTETDSDSGDYYTAGIATLEGGLLTIYNNQSYTQSSPLTALQQLKNFEYGTYFAANNTQYVFNGDGTGTIGINDITYTVSGNTIVVNNNGAEIIGTISSDGKVTSVGNVTLTQSDIFMGVWEKTATTHKQYTFDGKGNWSYEYYGYDANGLKATISSNSGTYTYNTADNSITLVSGDATYGVASFDENGLLKVVADGATQTYYKENSYVGTWRYFYRSETIEITLNGIGTSGYGTASVYYESLTQPISMTYDVRQLDGADYIYLFNGNVSYAALTYNTVNYTLTGYVYSFVADGTLSGVQFCLKDDYTGKWQSTEWGVVEFNGYGLYSLSGSTITTPVSGTVTINGTRVAYTLSQSTMNGTFTYKGVVYQISYDEVSDIVTVTANGSSFTLSRV